MGGGGGGGGGWAGANGVGVISFCAPENGGLHKILQPFLRGHVHMYFCAFQFRSDHSDNY